MRPIAPSPDAVANELLRLVLEDRGGGRERPLAEYQALFPGHEELVARELAGAGADSGAVDGELFAGYRLLRPIGRGGQGQVWLAEDPRLGRSVALKVLDGLALSPDALARFRREVLIASRLDDPGICAVYDAGEERGVPYLAMRYVPGRTLAELLEAAREVGARGSSALALPAADVDEGCRGAALEVARVLRTIERLARSLHAAHERDVVHRDVKPSNVVICDDGAPVLLDFGLARVQDHALGTLTRSGDVFGTPAYMAPEQIAGHAADRRADVWALGVLLHECLTLVRPFAAPTREALYAAILTRPAPDPRERNPQVGADLALVVETALEKDLSRRYASALELADELRRVRRGEPVRAR